MKINPCEICNSHQSKYKCSKCRILYCSVSCYKNHKITECKAESVSNMVENNQKTSYRYPTKDTVPLEKLRLLGKSTTLVNILKDRDLRELLGTIDSSLDPAKTIQISMEHPIFVNFVDECLRIVCLNG